MGYIRDELHQLLARVQYLDMQISARLICTKAYFFWILCEFTLKTLLEFNVSLSERAVDGARPIYLACLSNNECFVSVLAAAGTSVNIPDNLGMSPISTAAAHGHTKIMTALLKYKCDLTVCNKYSQTVLYHAAHYNHTEAVRLILTDPSCHQLDINHPDCDGVTALAIAAWDDHDKIVSILLGHRTDPNIRDKEGQNALHKACLSAHEENSQDSPETWGGSRCPG